ncbi:MAG: hypothetical protein AAFQ42_05800, partial [Pseudomonadota bacterium]
MGNAATRDGRFAHDGRRCAERVDAVHSPRRHVSASHRARMLVMLAFATSVVTLIVPFAATTSAIAQRTSSSDTRTTEKAFARRLGVSLNDLRDDFAAVGVLRCGNFVGTASLVGDTRTIVTAAHTFRYSARELR